MNMILEWKGFSVGDRVAVVSLKWILDGYHGTITGFISLDGHVLACVRLDGERGMTHEYVEFLTKEEG